jgi:hypothetical protein
MLTTIGAKQPYEEYYIHFNFSRYCGTATVVSATVTAVNYETDADVTSTIITAAKQLVTGQSVYVWVKAGTTGESYQITCKVVASDDSKYELDAMLPVVET